MAMKADEIVPFGCYYIARDYIDYLRENGDEHVPKADYEDEDRARKFYCGPVFTEYGVNFYVPVSHEIDKGNMVIHDKETNVDEQYGLYLRNSTNEKIGNLDFRFMIPCSDNTLLTPCELANYGAMQANSCLQNQTAIRKTAEHTYSLIASGDYPQLAKTAINPDAVNDAMWSYDDTKLARLKQRFARVSQTTFPSCASEDMTFLK